MAREASPGSALFRKCPSCTGGKIFREDSHEKCIYCLEEDHHIMEDCEICQGLSAATRRDRRLRVRARGSSSPHGRSPVPPSTSRSASAEPAAKKRHGHDDARGSRPSHKSSASTSAAVSTATADPTTSTRKRSHSRSYGSPSIRWDKPPSLVGPSIRGRASSTPPSTASPSTGQARPRKATDSRPRTSPSVTVDTVSTAPSTVQGKTTSTAPSTVQSKTTSTSSSTPSSTRPPSTEHPRTGYKSPSSQRTPQASEETITSMQDMLERQRRAMRKLEARLVAQDEERAREKELERTRFQTWMDEELKRQQQAFQQHLTEARQSEETRLATYRAEFQELAQRVPVEPLAPSDPVAEFQETARQELLREQERIRTGIDPLLGPGPRESDEETEDEEDQWGLHPAPDDDIPQGDPMEDPQGPMDLPLGPLGPLEPAPEEPPLSPTSPDPLPGPVGERPMKPSPPEDAPSFVSLVQRAAAHFNLPLEKSQPSSSYLLAKLAEPLRTVSALPMEPLLWDSGLELMKTPASTPAINARIDKKYRVPPSAPLCLRGQPSAASIIAASAKTPGAAQVPDHLLTPPSKGAKKWDAMGKRVLAASALQARTANYGAVLARYDRDMWDTMEEISKDLPEDKQVAAAAVLAEGRHISNTLLKVSLDSSDSAFRQMNNGVWMRRQGWLTDCAFGQEFHPKILNLPFDGANVFGQEVDALLLQEKTRKETMKAMTPITRGRASQASTSVFRQRARGPRGSFTAPFPQPQFSQSPSPYGQHGMQYPSPSYPAPQRGTYTPRQGGGKRRGSTRGQRPSPKNV